MNKISKEDQQAIKALESISDQLHTLQYSLAMRDYNSALLWVNDKKQRIESKGILIKQQYAAETESFKAVVKDNAKLYTYAEGKVYAGMILTIKNQDFLVTHVNNSIPALGTNADLLRINTVLTYTNEKGVPVRGLGVQAHIEGMKITLKSGQLPARDQLVLVKDRNGQLYQPKYLVKSGKQIATLELVKYVPEAKPEVKKEVATWGAY